jgi:putative heme transporter
MPERIITSEWMPHQDRVGSARQADRPVLLLASISLLIAAALMPYVDWLWRRTHSRAFAVGLVVCGVLAALVVLLVVVVPPMVSQGRDLWEQAPELQAQAAQFAGDRGWYDLQTRIATFEWNLDQRVEARLIDTSRTVLDVVVALVTVFFLSAYFVLDARRLKLFVYFSTPRTCHPHIRALLPALQRVVGGYIRGQAITSGAIFVVTFVLLTVMGVPNALALAALAAIFDLIPMVGVYLVVLVVALPALLVSVTTAAVVVRAMLLYQQAEDRVLVPRIYGTVLRLPTIAVVLAILVGAELLGIVGALLALPVAAGIRVVVEYFAEVRRASPREAADDAAADDELFAPNAERARVGNGASGRTGT